MKQWAFNLHILDVPLLEADGLFPHVTKRWGLVILELPPDRVLAKRLIQKWKPLVASGGFLVGYGFGRKGWEDITLSVKEELGDIEEQPNYTWVYRC